jgi:uncharacterized membrane protein
MTAILISFFGYSVLAVGQVYQKMGMNLKQNKKNSALPVLIIANIVTVSSSFIILAAVSQGQISVVGAMAGSGLITMAIAGRMILFEPITSNIIYGISLIIAGIFLLGWFSELSDSHYYPVRLAIFSFLITFIFIILILFSKQTSLMGIFIGGLSGSWAGLVALLQKSADMYQGPALLPDSFTEMIKIIAGTVLIPEAFTDEALRVLINPYVPLWVLISTSSMIMIHFAFLKGHAVTVIPVYTALLIIVPVSGGFLAFNENLNYLQWIGVIVIIAGSLLVNMKRKFS